MTRDPKESRDPREIAGLCKAIPKDNLGKLVIERYGSYRAFESVVGYSQVGEIVKGNRRMANAKLLRAANVLQVSPLYLLDLTDSKEPKVNEVNAIVSSAHKMHEAITGDLAILNDADLTRKKIDYYFDPYEFEESIGFLGESVTVYLMEEEGYELDEEGFPVKYFPDDIHPEHARLVVMPHIRGIRGDYRDLDELTRDMLSMYPDTLTALLTLPPIGNGD